MVRDLDGEVKVTPLASVSEYQRKAISLLDIVALLREGGPLGRLGVVIGEGARVGNGLVKGPAVIGDGVVIERSTVVGPHAILGEGSVIRMGARVEDSVPFEGVTVGEHSRLHGVVVGGGAQLGSFTKLDPGVVVGDGATVGEHAFLAVDVRIHPGRHVGESVLVPGGVV